MKESIQTRIRKVVAGMNPQNSKESQKKLAELESELNSYKTISRATYRRAQRLIEAGSSRRTRK